jgi:hypothetical protein
LVDANVMQDDDREKKRIAYDFKRELVALFLVLAPQTKAMGYITQ